MCSLKYNIKIYSNVPKERKGGKETREQREQQKINNKIG